MTPQGDGGPDAPGGPAVVTLGQSLDADVAAGLVELVRGACEQGSGVVLDGSAITRVDSAGLGSLIRGLKAARDSGCRLAIARPSAELDRMLALTGLDRVLPIEKSLDAARACLEEPPA
jgi:anti-sigma B factor antagonist